MHSWLASADQEKQVSASDRHISNGKFAALSVENSGFTSECELSSDFAELSSDTVPQETSNMDPATSNEIEVNTGLLVDNEVHS
jgi:hypothetical protein